MSFKSCNDCSNRVVEPNCHMTCQDYLSEVEEQERIKKIKNDHYVVKDVIYRSVYRCMKARKTKNE